MDHEKKALSIICVGVGKGGIQALGASRAYLKNLRGLKVRCVALDSDSETLGNSQEDEVIQVGNAITRGLGCHGEPRVASKIAEASRQLFKELSGQHDLLCLFCGLGGGTGSVLGAEIAKAARPGKALRVSICSLPFDFESTRVKTALWGLSRLQEHCHITLSLSLEDLIKRKDKHAKSAQGLFREGQARMLEALRGLLDPLTMPTGEQYWGKLRQLWGGKKGAYVFANVRLEDLTTAQEGNVATLVEHLMEQSALKDHSFSIEDLLVCLRSQHRLKQEALEAIHGKFQQNFTRLKQQELEVIVDPNSPNMLEIKVFGRLEANRPSLESTGTQKEFDFHAKRELLNEPGGEDLDEPTYLRKGIKIPFK